MRRGSGGRRPRNEYPPPARSGMARRILFLRLLLLSLSYYTIGAVAHCVDSVPQLLFIIFISSSGWDGLDASSSSHHPDEKDLRGGGGSEGEE